MGSWHLVGDDGVPWSAGAAIAPLLRLLPGGRAPAALVARVPRAAEAGTGRSPAGAGGSAAWCAPAPAGGRRT